MIITVTLNAAIDKTLAVPNFRLGRRHRAVEQTAMAGGKGVNVARALRALGQPVIATGVAGGPTGTRIIEHLTEEGILNDFVRIREESRTSTAVVDPTSGEQTEINEHGPHVTEAELELFVDKLLYLAKGAAVCVFAGSLPRGVDAGLYGRLIEEMKRLGVIDRARLRGRAAEPRHPQGARTSSRPNELEAEGLVGHEFSDDDDRRRGVGEMVELGAREAIMTLPDGCLAMLGERRASAASTARRSSRSSRSPSVGSGRRLPGRLRGGPLRRAATTEDCLRFAVACGAESTQHFGAGVLEQREVERLLPEVRVEQLATPGRLHANGVLTPVLTLERSSAVEPRIAPMEVEIGRGKKGRRAYGFDDIAIVPSRRTRDPDDIDITWTLGPYRFELPLLASAMDGVVSPDDRGHPRQARRPRRS